MMRNLFHIALAGLALGVLLAGNPALAAESISVEVRSIAASKDGKGVDSSLQDMKSKLEKVFGNYSKFEQLDRTSIQLDKNQKKSVSLPEGSTLKITFHGFANDLIKLGISVAGKLSTTLRASSGSTFFQAGLEYGDGILILAITVER